MAIYAGLANICNDKTADLCSGYYFRYLGDVANCNGMNIIFIIVGLFFAGGTLAAIVDMFAPGVIYAILDGFFSQFRKSDFDQPDTTMYSESKIDDISDIVDDMKMKKANNNGSPVKKEYAHPNRMGDRPPVTFEKEKDKSNLINL
ncbi:MAG TPA: hypothetical protein VMW66_00585 [Elusimicrobiales bacterium]|nr:hypothetical protein [Elusimicrobiales bacterium]